MRGFLYGILWGFIAITAVVAVVSLLAPLPSGPEVDSNAPGSARQSIDSEAESGIKAAGVDADLVDAAPTVPGSNTESDTLASMENADLDSAARPVVGGETTLVDPDRGDSSRAETGSATSAPVSGATPGALGQEQAVPNDLGTVAQASAEQPAVSSDATGLNTPTNNDSSVDVAGNGDSPVATAAPTTAPSASQQDTQLALSNEPTQPVLPTVSDSGSGFGDNAPKRIAVLPQNGAEGGTSRTSIGTAVVPLTERNETAIETVAAVGGKPPIELYKERFENPDNKPMMSIILIDDDESIGVEALANFPQPLTMAVDPASPDAAEKMARHRAAGFEVVSLIDLPKAATAQDAEVALAASFAAMPEVVAVLEGPNSGVQGNRSLADQVSAIVEGTGHGIILQDNGLNTVYKLAERTGIPAGVVFRDFDGAGQTGSVMRRFLDQAAFRAGQDGAVIMLGRVRPDTVSTLLLWALQDRATRVALAPVSAVLTSDDAE